MDLQKIAYLAIFAGLMAALFVVVRWFVYDFMPDSWADIILVGMLCFAAGLLIGDRFKDRRPDP